MNEILMTQHGKDIKHHPEPHLCLSKAGTDPASEAILGWQPSKSYTGLEPSSFLFAMCQWDRTLINVCEQMMALFPVPAPSEKSNPGV